MRSSVEGASECYVPTVRGYLAMCHRVHVPSYYYCYYYYYQYGYCYIIIVTIIIVIIIAIIIMNIIISMIVIVSIMEFGFKDHIYSGFWENQ